MRYIRDNLDEVQGVVAGQKATVDIKVDRPVLLHEINLIFEAHSGTELERRSKAHMLAEIESVEVYINNKRQRELPISDLFADEEMRGGTIKNGIVPVRFSRLERQTTIGQDASAFIAGGRDDMRLEIKLAAGVSQPSLKVENVIESLSANRVQALTQRTTLQVIETVERDVQQVTKTGVHRFFYEGDSQGRDLSLMKIHTRDMSNIDVYRGQQLLWRGTPDDFDRWMEQAGYVAPTDSVVFFPEAYAGGRLTDTYQFRGQRLRFEVTMTAATSFDVTTHYYGDAAR